LDKDVRSSPPRNAIVSLELEGPLDRAVRALLRASWGTARAWIASGKVRVAGRLVTEPTARVRAGQTLSFDERARSPTIAGLAEDAIVYVDAHVVVVAKPPGLATVPYERSMTRGSAQRSSDDALDARVRAWLVHHTSAGRRADVRPNLGVVHRLDKETSGLVVFTRTWLAKQSLAAQFRKHTVWRRYLAIVHGDATSRTIRSFLVEDRGDGLRGSTRRAGRLAAVGGAREAVTHVEFIESLRGATLIGCRLETGRTHQIRIHMSEAGHPLVGERVYVRGWEGRRIAATRLMLHAAELGFVHPATERAMRWEQPMPEDMREVCTRLRSTR
jgi:23S rRNA pseudouridine1911/1915/1917 synthase